MMTSIFFIAVHLLSAGLGGSALYSDSAERRIFGTSGSKELVNVAELDSAGAGFVPDLRL